MRDLLGGILAGLLFLLPSTASATPTVEYFDDISWRTAAAALGYSIHSYTGGVTITTYTTTIETVSHDDPNAPYIVFGPVISAYHQTGLAEIQGDFFFGSACDTSPGCVMTNLTELDVTFDSPIAGIEFFSPATCTDGENCQLSINPGGWLILTYEGTGGSFGLLGGPISELDFIVSGFSDSPNRLQLSNIFVATAPEPGTLALVLGGGLAFGMLRPGRTSKSRSQFP
jgi:hypothetical protein